MVTFERTNSDMWHICGIGKACEDDLLADCRHGISNDLVLKLDWELVEGEYPIDLVVSHQGSKTHKPRRTCGDGRLDQVLLQRFACSDQAA